MIYLDPKNNILHYGIKNPPETVQKFFQEILTHYRSLIPTIAPGYSYVKMANVINKHYRTFESNSHAQHLRFMSAKAIKQASLERFRNKNPQKAC
jgi:hypothetical protein